MKDRIARIFANQLLKDLQRIIDQVFPQVDDADRVGESRLVRHLLASPLRVRERQVRIAAALYDKVSQVIEDNAVIGILFERGFVNSSRVCSTAQFVVDKSEVMQH